MQSVLIARLILSGAFVVAAWGKLSDREGTKLAFVELGVPASVAPPVTSVLPLVEVFFAGLLLFAETAVAGALGCLALLCVFSAVVAVNLARGNRPDCNCFGRLYQASISGWTLVRNGVLAALAVFVLANG